MHLERAVRNPLLTEKKLENVHALFNFFVGIEKNDQKLEGIEKGGKDFSLQKNLPEDDAFMETDEVEPEGKSYPSRKKKNLHIV